MCRSPGETVSHILALLLCTTDRKASYHYALPLLFVVAIVFSVETNTDSEKRSHFLSVTQLLSSRQTVQ